MPKQRPPGAPDNFFSLSRPQRRAILLLLLIGGLACLTPWLLPHWFEAPAPAPIDPAFETELTRWVEATQRLDDSVAAAKAAQGTRYASRKASYSQPRYPRYDSARRRAAAAPAGPLPTLASLDANTVDSLTLRRLGLPRYLAGRWVKYRAKGGAFREPADIAKLYGLEDSTYRRIVGYFAVAAEDATAERAGPAGEARAVGDLATPSPARPASLERVDLNAATPADLEQIRGIGPYFAGKIIDYRDRLGGYVSADQLREVPRLPDSLATAIADQLVIDPGAVRRVAINSVSVEDLQRQPYLTWTQARTIVAYRDNHGPFDSAAALTRTVVISDALATRLAPYFDFALPSGQ